MYMETRYLVALLLCGGPDLGNSGERVELDVKLSVKLLEQQTNAGVNSC